MKSYHFQACALAFSALFISNNILYAQVWPVKEWDKRFGGSGSDALYAIQQTTDGGYLLGGDSDSPVSGDKSQDNKGSTDFWMVKTNAAGTKEWDKSFGGNLAENMYAVMQTNDGGFILGGESKSGISGDKTQNARGGLDYWIVKTDASGAKQWDVRFGGSGDDELRSVQQTIDGGYILAGFSSSGISGDKSEASRGVTDYWLVKTDANGTKQWDARFGGASNDELRSCMQTIDGGYILAGFSKSGIGGDKTIACKGATDYWIVKTNATGVKEWDAVFGGSESEYLYAIQQTADEGYILGGYSESGITGDVTEDCKGGYDFWIVKTDAAGVKQWDKRYGGSGYDKQKFIQQTTDGGYLLAGWSDSGISGDKTQANVGNGDYWVVKTDATGVKMWDATYGGALDDKLHCVPQTNDGGYLLGGYTYSYSGEDVTQASQGWNDYWIVKISSNTSLQDYFADTDGDGFGNPAHDTLAMSPPSGFVANNKDCADSNPEIHPAANDLCNGIDDNCNLLTDENAMAIPNISPAGSIAICPGTQVTFATEYATNVSYQWIKNGVNISGATGLTFQTGNNGSYTVAATNGYGCSAISAVTLISKLTGANAEIVPLGDLNICQSMQVALQANAGIGLNYQWLSGANNIAGATNQIYLATKAASYKVKVTNADGCSKHSPAVQVTKSCKVIASSDMDKELQWSLYPNPTKGRFIIMLPVKVASEAWINGPGSSATLSLFNSMGKLVYSERTPLPIMEGIKEVTLPATCLPGVYFVSVTIGSLEYPAKLMLIE